MKRLFFLFWVLWGCLTSLNTYSQVYQVDWSKHAGSDITDLGRIVRTDMKGNVYIAGSVPRLKKTIIADELSKTLWGDFIEDYPTNMFIAKYDSTGKIFWMKTAEDKFELTGYMGLADITFDSSDNVYMTGLYMGNQYIDNELVYKLESYLDLGNIFILKYDKDGNLIWKKSFGNSVDGIEAGLTIHNISDTSLIITGYFEHDCYFDDIKLEGEENKNHGYIANINANDGKLNWVKTYPTTGEFDFDKSIITSDGYLYVFGHFDDTLILNSDTLVHIPPDIENLKRSFITKFDLTGEPIWSIEGKWVNYFRRVSVASDSNLYIIFNYKHYFKLKDQICFGDSSDKYYWNMAIACISPDGEIKWLKNIPKTGTDDEPPYYTLPSKGIAMNSEDNLFVILGKEGDLFIDDSLIASSANGECIHTLLHMDKENGEVKSSQILNDKKCVRVSYQDLHFHNKTAYTCGYFYDTLEQGDTSITSYGKADIFLTRLSPYSCDESDLKFRTAYRSRNFDDSNGKLYFTAYGGSPPYLFSINGVDYQSSGKFYNLDKGKYKVFIQDSYHCKESMKVEIK